MQETNAALSAELLKGFDDPRDLVDLYELYDNDAVPGAGGFDPTDAEETFAAEEITWNGVAYRRELKTRGDISRSMGEKTNNVTLNFSNISRYMASLAQTVALEGKILIVRTVARSVTTDSLSLFVGRADKPGDITKRDFSLSARQDFGNINVTVPTSQYVAEDPNGLQPGNDLYEGIRFVAQTGLGPGGMTTVPSKSFFGRLFGRSKRVAVMEHWSSLDFTPYGEVIREIFGTAQVQAVPIMFADIGYWLNWLGSWCKGPIKGVTNIELKNFEAYGLYDVQTHTGEIGGTGDALVRDPLVHITGGNITEDFRFPGSGLFSRLAFSGISILHRGINDEPIVIDEPPVIVGLVQGRRIDLPDGSGVFNRFDWSDNPAYIARFILTNDRFANINPAFMDDAVIYRTGLHCDEPLVDLSNSQTILIPAIETGQAGNSFKRFQSAAIISPANVKYLLGDLSEPATSDEPGDGPYTPLPAPPTPIPDTFTTVPVLIRRYTANLSISEEVRAVDLVYKNIFPTGKLFMKVGKNGKVGIYTEQPSSATKVRTATVVGATSINVLDVTPWKTGPDLLTGRLRVGALTGPTITDSEVRDLLSADFSTSGNSVSLDGDATGTLALTPSGAFLAGGSTTVQASGTLTLLGVPAPGDTITATIDGEDVEYTLTSADTTETAAAMLAAYINANTTLRPYIRASWDSGSPSVVTVTCLHGALNLTSATGFPAFLKAHDVGEEILRIAMSFATNSQDVYSAWPASTLILLNDIYLPTVLNGHKYQVTTGGTTGSSEPVWPTTAGATVASGTAVFTEIGSTVLAQAGLKRANIVKDSFRWPLGSTQSSVNQIKGKFRDKVNDFAETPFKVNDAAHQAQVKKIYPKEIDLTAVDNFNQVFRLASAELAKNREGDWFAALEAGPSALVLEEGDLICVSDDSGGLVNVVTRIEDLSIKPNHHVVIQKSRLYSTNMFSDDVTATPIVIPSTLRHTQTADSVIAFIDNFAIRDADALIPGFYVAVSRNLALQGDWRGYKLYADYGDGYVYLGVFGDVAATMGTADTILDTVTDATVFDTTSSLDFTLKFGTPEPAPEPFATVTEADLIANPYRNLFLVGSEYLQAATVVPNGDQSYTISDFYRGRFGTTASQLTHVADEDVVYLNGAEKFVPIDPARAGIAYNYKAVTINQNVADADPVSFTWSGGSIRPRPPIDLIGIRDGDGDWFVYADGQPRASEIPENYVMRLTRASDGEFLRDIPIFTGISLAAIFGDTFGDISVVNNNLSALPTLEFTAAVTDILTIPGHRFVEDSKVRVTSTGTLPAPLLIDTDYFIWDDGSLGANEVKLAATLGGSPINITTTGTGTHSIRPAPFQVVGARTSQEFTGPGSFLEIELPALDSFAGGSLNIGFFHSDDAGWTDTSAWTVGVYTLRITVVNVVTGEWAISFWDVGGEDAGQILVDGVSIGTGPMKLRLTFSGTELRVYKNWDNSGTSPLVISRVPPAEHFPMKPAFYLATGAVNSNAARIDRIVMGGATEPSTIYSLAQQEADLLRLGVAGGTAALGIVAGNLGVELWQSSRYPNTRGGSVSGVF